MIEDENLAKRLKELPLTIDKVAKLLRTHPNTIGNWYRNDSVSKRMRMEVRNLLSLSEEEIMEKLKFLTIEEEFEDLADESLPDPGFKKFLDKIPKENIISFIEDNIEEFEKEQRFKDFINDKIEGDVLRAVPSFLKYYFENRE